MFFLRNTILNIKIHITAFLGLLKPSLIFVLNFLKKNKIKLNFEWIHLEIENKYEKAISRVTKKTIRSI